MSELFETIWKYGVLDPYSNQRDFPFQEGTPMPVLIDASNVAVYTHATLPSWEELQLATDNSDLLFNVAPPWPLFWMEYADPVKPADTRYGVLVSSYDLREIPDDDPMRDHLPTGCYLPGDARWVLYTVHFASFRGAPIVMPLGLVVTVLEDGTVGSSAPIVINEHTVKEFERHTSMHGGQVAAYMTSQLTVPLMAVQFSHCKNVELDEPKPKTRNERRQQQRRQKKAAGRSTPTFTFKTLDIGPVENLLEREGNIKGQGMAKALHVCRGHWKDYRQRGLFGNDDLKGMYFVGMHVRGNKQLGAVHKNYRVNPS